MPAANKAEPERTAAAPVEVAVFRSTGSRFEVRKDAEAVSHRRVR